MAFSNHKAKIALFASVALGLGGLILMVMEAYFAFLRPPLLPEDLKYMSSSSAQIQSAVPGLLPWLTHVFSLRVLYSQQVCLPSMLHQQD